MHHDVCYKKADEGEKTRSDCDETMLDELNATKNLGFREKTYYAMVKPTIWTKYKLVVGVEEATELHKPITIKFKSVKLWYLISMICGQLIYTLLKKIKVTNIY